MSQAARIAARFGVPHIATGALLRSHVERGTPLGRAVRVSIEAGRLVPDRVVRDTVREAMADAKAAGVGYVLDGHPRPGPRGVPDRGRAGHDRPPRAAPARR
ncbi:nucleoside monophosphate kinase [Dactylosporangium sp. NPDC000555]|uniref:adenylate kinase family protein n=1 Tax=Dactylosporangium sp. NPDC000555 TaxID=3154260 RepID=UPI00332AE43E